MLKIEAIATTWYTYELTEEEENAVKKLIEENEDGKYDYMSEEEKIVKAFSKLYNDGKTNLYQNSNTVESDFNTESFGYSEFNECNAEEWLENREE